MIDDILLVAATAIYPVLFIISATCFSPCRSNILFTKTVSKGSIKLTTIPLAVNSYINIAVLRITTKLLGIENIANSKLKGCFFIKKLFDYCRINGIHVISNSIILLRLCCDTSHLILPTSLFYQW